MCSRKDSLTQGGWSRRRRENVLGVSILPGWDWGVGVHPISWPKAEKKNIAFSKGFETERLMGNKYQPLSCHVRSKNFSRNKYLDHVKVETNDGEIYSRCKIWSHPFIIIEAVRHANNDFQCTLTNDTLPRSRLCEKDQKGWPWWWCGNGHYHRGGQLCLRIPGSAKPERVNRNYYLKVSAFLNHLRKCVFVIIIKKSVIEIK